MDKNKDVIEIFDSSSSDSDQAEEAGGSGNRKRTRSVTEISDESENSEDEGDGEGDIEWIEESSSESEPDLECDVWDDDCVTVPKQHRKNAVFGYHLIPACEPEPKNPSKQCKFAEIPALNEYLTTKEFLKEFKDNWDSSKSMTINSVELMTEPFKLCVIDQFLDNSFVLEEIRKEMYEISWNKRSLDLYEFFQSKDLTFVEHKFINKVHEFLKTDVMSWVTDLTGLELNKVSATCSVYTDTDYLLVHDDLQEDRSIAFILYLTDTTNSSGALELFKKDDKGHPTVSCKQILPKNNRFVFFKVTADSYHQVAEIVNMDESRMSINGWFHTPKPDLYKTPELEAPLKGLFSSERLGPVAPLVPLETWIASQYLNNATKFDINQHIETESEISLHSFFKADKFEQLCETLKNDDIIWECVGPPNRRKYEVICNDNKPRIVEEFLNLFQSKTMFSLLKEYTDLDLEETDEVKPTVRMELQRWKPGCYSLLSEYDWQKENELDLILYLGNVQVVGGHTMYLSTDDKVEDALITIQPKPNVLNLVFRDTARIIKHVSKRSSNQYFYMIVCSYKEHWIINK